MREEIRTARITGIWYLMLAISGMVGFLTLHPQVYISNDAAKTLANLGDHETLARIRLLLEFAIVISQALAAVWFFKLFKDINHTAAWALAAWGTLNAAAIMISAMAMGGALGVASSTHSLEDKVIMIEILNQFIRNAWGVGSIFFGLWLIPMGYIVISSKRMPVWLGRVLIIGGAGYLISMCISYAGIKGAWLDMLVIPATIGEFWMISYLLIFGIRPSPEPSQT
jgi:hypothetical protein